MGQCHKRKNKEHGEKDELIADRALFGRMVIVITSRLDLNFKDVIGKYEPTVVPRSMFAADGTMLHCTKEGDLVDIIQESVEGDVHSDILDEVVIKPVVEKCVFGVVSQVMKMCIWCCQPSNENEPLYKLPMMLKVI